MRKTSCERLLTRVTPALSYQYSTQILQYPLQRNGITSVSSAKLHMNVSKHI